MTRREYFARRFVIALARHIPVETPGWATAMIFVPLIFATTLVRGTITAFEHLGAVGKLFTHKQLVWTEIFIFCLALFVSLSFLCRLLQICCPKYYDMYKVEEES